MFTKVTLLILLTLSLFGNCVWADLTIRLSSQNETITDSLTWSVYQDMWPLRTQFANVHSNPVGLVYYVIIYDDCSSNIEPFPEEVASSYSVFALVNVAYTSECDYIDIVRNAGYDLLILFNPLDEQRTVTKEIQNSGFPVVVVTEDYAQYLIEHVALQNWEDFDDFNAILATITASILTSVVTMACAMSVLLFMCCCCCCVCLLCCRSCSRERDIERHLEEIEERRRTFEQAQGRERYARQELIESILRQLAELQVDLRLQVPLGEQATKRLPTRRYRTGQEKMESCAICVDDFADGDTLRILPCEHAFHSKCIDEWLINHSSLCPLCKAEVPRPNAPRAGNGPYRINNFTTDDDISTSDFDSSDSLIPSFNRDTPRPGNSSSRGYGSV